MELETLMAVDHSSLPPKVRVAVAVIGLTASTIVGIALHEDYREKAYIPVKGDVYTIGYGSTKDVKAGDKTTPARALTRLYDEVEGIYATGVKKCITVELYPYELGAYIMLAYSVGVPTVCRKAKPDPKTGKIEPNLIDLINARRYEEACARIEAFNKGPGGVVLPGLVKRRKYERAMCEGQLEPDYQLKHAA
jgi:lysozyme